MAKDSRSRTNFQVGVGLRGAWLALLVLAALVALLAVSLWVGLQIPTRIYLPGKPLITDADLYRMVVADMRRGESYYQAVAHEHRAYRYALHPFLAVRPPAMATVLSWLPTAVAGRWLAGALALATVVAWGQRFRDLGAGKVRLVLLVALAGVGAYAASRQTTYLFHELWAGLLISLSLAIHRPGRWWPSVVVGLLAAVTRELAVGYLLVMALMAFRDGRRGEMAAWLAAIVVFALALAGHAHAVTALARPGDLGSQGWFKISGWSLVIATMRWNTVFRTLPAWVPALLLPFSLLGAAMWRHPLGERLALILFGYVAGFMLIGRMDNTYWGLMIAPLVPLGILFAPEALRTLVRNLGPKPACAAA